MRHFFSPPAPPEHPVPASTSSGIPTPTSRTPTCRQNAASLTPRSEPGPGAKQRAGSAAPPPAAFGGTPAARGSAQPWRRDPAAALSRRLPAAPSPSSPLGAPSPGRPSAARGTPGRGGQECRQPEYPCGVRGEPSPLSSLGASRAGGSPAAERRLASPRSVADVLQSPAQREPGRSPFLREVFCRRGGRGKQKLQRVEEEEEEEGQRRQESEGHRSPAAPLPVPAGPAEGSPLSAASPCAPAPAELHRQRRGAAGPRSEQAASQRLFSPLPPCLPPDRPPARGSHPAAARPARRSAARSRPPARGSASRGRAHAPAQRSCSCRRRWFAVLACTARSASPTPCGAPEPSAD